MTDKIVLRISEAEEIIDMVADGVEKLRDATSGEAGRKIQRARVRLQHAQDFLAKAYELQEDER